MDISDALREVRSVYRLQAREHVLKKPRVLEQQNNLYSSGSALERISLAEVNGYLRDTLLRDVDAISMWHSLEVRPVLLDYPLVEFALGLPDDYKIRHGRFKAIFVDAVKDLIPSEVWQRRKTGFDIPLAHWMNGVLKPHINGLWESPSARMIFNDRYLKEMKRKSERGQLHRRDWLPVVLVSWCNEYGIGDVA
jgi:asparagine synthase (glutamine-hydrolysing)